jgi:uncharacterized damage-inducible protein DinB
MYHTIKEFNDHWKGESEATLKLLSVLTDKSLNYESYKGGRTLGFIAWHIVASMNSLLSQLGFKLDRKIDGSQAPKTAKELVDAYKKSVLLVNKNISAWTDESLTQKVILYGREWTRAMALSSLIMHQVHHRGQLTILMRQAGLKVPGVYGPSKEEWALMKMPAQP